MTIPVVSFTAVGDYIGQRRIDTRYPGFDRVAAYIRRGDARFFNLETTVSRQRHWANQFCGGSYLQADPGILEDARAFGFNLCTFANNHAFDYGYAGFFDTRRHVQEAGLVFAGAGDSLDDAVAPGYLELPGARVALLSVSVSFGGTDHAAAAGKQSRRTPGRPGINLLHIDETLYLSPEDFAAMQRISTDSGINAELDIARAEGYMRPLPEGIVTLGEQRCRLGEKTEFVCAPNEADMARLEKEIYNAGMFADYILVSIHSHQISGKSKETPGRLLEEFAHRCIDAGAHAVLGSGPHLLRPLELYRGRPIFYSLGNFVLHNENIQVAPEEMFNKFGMDSDDTLRDLFAVRSGNYTRGLMSDHRMHESVIPCFRFEGNELRRLELMPIELDFQEPRYRRGNPHFCPDGGILERLQQLSAPYGTQITIGDDGCGVVTL